MNHALDPNGPGWPNPPWSTFLFRRLMQNETFRDQFILRSCDLLNSNFTFQAVSDKISFHHDLIEDEIADHSIRWGGSQNQWEQNIQTLDNFALYRPGQYRSHLMNHFNLSGPVNVGLNIEPNEGGRLQVNSLQVNEFPWSGVYFPDISVSVTALPNPGYRFIGWTPAVGSNDATVSITPGVHDLLTARFVPDTSFQSIIVINEINYNSPGSAETGDWVEFYNNTNEELDLDGWIFKDSDDSHIFEFPPETSIQPREYLVLCRDSSLFISVHDQVDQLVGNMNFGLSGSGELIRLYNGVGYLIDSLTYDDEDPWPTAADGTGPTLELISPVTDNSVALNWSYSNGFGSPGSVNDSYLPLTVLAAGHLPEQIELYQNYPNPFNNSTMITIALPFAGNVLLSVIDLTGRQIANLHNGMEQPGLKQYSWSGRNNNGQLVSSGVYLYRLQVDNQVLSRKLILIK